MINYHYEGKFHLEDSNKYTSWIKNILESENAQLGELSYIFCTDEYLIELNQKYLKHNSYTDIITFDYSEKDIISGEIYISVDRVRENALHFNEEFNKELQRVMAHGVLHLLGYKDKTEKEREKMRTKENEKIKMFHVKQ
ncbi:rRNA maturation RNase YbeY [uncultured Eudoraea sp.]|jgi:rRNA maturation RNase YbeY|uniref:rRNA maturation RNase YbeY n=1 Tax=uncultured Eudoraea sp. TaxID=1035614 RepID=UPI00260756E4|nr:rRNA maturation RNase YbeY [uncultured Eudoraea sp.]